MNLKTAIAGALFGVFGISAHAYDLLNDWPTKIKTDDGYEFGVKGNYQGDLNNYSGDTTNASGTTILEDQQTWRRKEFNVYGKTPWGIDFNVGVDFSTSNNTWIDNFVRYSNKDVGEFRLGQFKTPVGWEEGGTASSATTFLERALPVQAVNMGRRLGFDWSYQWTPQWLTTFGYYSGGDLQGDNDGNGPSAHVVFNPIKEKNEVIHLGLAVSEESRDETTDGRGVVSSPTARFRARPEANLTGTRLIDSGNLSNADNIDRVGLEGAWIRGPLLVQGEYLHFNADFTDSKPSYSGDGWYVFGAWMLTGESRDYKNGSVGNVKPANEWGAIEIAARYSELDLNDGVVLGGKEHDWTIGANWYLGNHLKLQANYVRAYSDKFNSTLHRAFEIDPEVLELRAEVYF